MARPDCSTTEAEAQKSRPKSALFHSREAITLRQEITALVRDDTIRKQLCDVSPWKISLNKPGRAKYKLQRAAKAPPDVDSYFLANLVLQGGGTLGLAHAGFVVGLEEAGFRFPALAGTSAGAIIISGIIAQRGDDVTQAVGLKLSQLVSDVPMDQFIDAPRPVRRAIKRFVASRSVLHPIYWPGLLASVRRVMRRRGLNLGWEFLSFMRSVFSDAKLNSTEDLSRQLNQLAATLDDAEMEQGEDCPFKDTKGSDLFKMIATAMPTGTKMCFPEDIYLLHEECKTASPALLVRMSMAIPLFFEPVTQATSPTAWKAFVEAKIAKFVDDQTAENFGELNSLTFLDGGLFSNLPTDEVEKSMSAEIPSISVPLVSPGEVKKYKSHRRTSSLIKQTFAVFDAVRLQRDRDVHDGSNPRRVLAKIDTGSAHWLNFAMSPQEKDELFLKGLEAARDLIAKGMK